VLKNIVLLLSIFTWTHASAISYEPQWSESFEKTVKMSCQEGEFQCEDLCGESTCVVKEKVCRNCIGSNILITHIFRDMGRSYISTANEVSYYEVLELLQSGNFASFTSKSVYNIVERYDSMALRQKFQSLCPNGTKYPVVLFKTKEISRILDQVQYVLCGDMAFEMSDEAEIDVNKNAKFIDNNLY
jgi:hypothetical protein